MNTLKNSPEAAQILSLLAPHFKKYSEQSEDERNFLFTLVQKYKPKKIVEIGVSAGASAIVISSAMQTYMNQCGEIKPHLFSLDYSTEWYRNNSQKTGFLMDSFPEFKTSWTLHTGGMACKFMDSIGKDIDFIFINTAHWVPGEILNFLMAYPYLSEGCIVVFHNTNTHTTRIASGLRSPFTCVNNILVSSIAGEPIVPDYANTFYSLHKDSPFPHYKLIVESATFNDLRCKILTLGIDKKRMQDKVKNKISKHLNWMLFRFLKKIYKFLIKVYSKIVLSVRNVKKDTSPLDIPFPNMAAIILDKKVDGALWKVFNLLTMPWYFFPKDTDLDDVVQHFDRHYDEFFNSMFKTTLSWHKHHIDVEYKKPQTLLQIPKHVRYVHLLFNDKFIKPTVDMLNAHFPHEEHIFLCKRSHEEFPFPEGDNVFEVASYAKFDLGAKHIKKIIAHSFFDGEVIDYLYNNKHILKGKAYWLIWGGDLYNAPRDEKNDYVRKNCRGYIPGLDGNFVEEKYGLTKYIHPTSVVYTFPISLKLLNSLPLNKKSEIRIQVNNSSDYSTLEILDTLEKYKNENIKIITVLSYGDLSKKEEIIAKGQSIFGKKFEFIDKMLSPSCYASHLMQNDILILGQNRQQGFGNTLASLYLGKKVFIKGNISVYNFLNKSNIKIYDTNLIGDLSFDEFVTYSEKDVNKSNVIDFVDDKTIVHNWYNVLNDK